MNGSTSPKTELNDAEPVDTKPVATIPPTATASTAVKVRSAARAATRTSKAPVAAKLTTSKAVTAPISVATKAPGKVRTRAIPAATAKPKAVPVPVPVAKAVSGTKEPARARATKAVAEVAAPAQGQAKLLSEAKKAKETKHLGKKPKLVRDSFTFPVGDYALIALLKQRALKAGHEVKKSELLRVGLRVLSALSETTLIKALGSIDKLKPGRPTK